jgi:nondiscriminating aspartyl-tRNA synthetase
MESLGFGSKRKMIGDIGKENDGEKVVVAGWVYDLRDLGKVRFVVLRDASGEIQVTALKASADREVFDLMNRVNRESVVVVHGKVVKNEKASNGRELIPSSFEILSSAQHPLPIDVSDFSKTELPKRLDFRFLDFHRRKTQAIFKIQSTISNAFREHFLNEGFVEMQPPCVIGAASEGGTDLFSVKYFEQKAYLAQSPQLYKQMLACSMEKIFLSAPVWRAEKHNTIRHINEIRQMDIEVAFDDQMATMKRHEAVCAFMIRKILERNEKDLELLGIKNLKVPKGVYLHYKDAIEELKSNGISIEHGEDLHPEAEKKLGELYPGDVVYVHSWPRVLKPFYIMPSGAEAEAEYSEGFDAIYLGLEITSGGQRIHLPDLLIEMIEAKGLDPLSFKDYIDSFRYGAPPHAGWSIGLERFTMLVCGLDNIRDATMFPRDRDRLTP